MDVPCAVQGLHPSVQAAFNVSLLEEAVPSAWVDALAALRERFAHPFGGTFRPCQTLYAAVPDAHLPPAAPDQAAAKQQDALIAVFVARKASLEQPETSPAISLIAVLPHRAACQ